MNLQDNITDSVAGNIFAGILLGKQCCWFTAVNLAHVPYCRCGKHTSDDLEYASGFIAYWI